MIRYIKRLLSLLYPTSLQGQMFILVFLIVFGALFVSGAIFISFIGNNSKAQISKKTLDIAHLIAMMPLTHEVLQVDKDPDGKIQQLAEQIRKKTGAAFVVIANKQSLRFSHPDPEKVGKHFMGGDEQPALEQGKAYVSEVIGSLGPSLRSIVPVLNNKGDVLGFISVGYLQKTVTQIVKGYQREPATLIFMLFVVVILGATQIARYIKKQTLGLEPREISSLYVERQAVFQSIRDGIIAVSKEKKIRLINQAALEFCNFDSDKNLIGKCIDDVFAHSDFKILLQPDSKELFREVKIDGQNFLFTSVSIKYDGAIDGIVASFRRIEDFHKLQEELHQTRQFSEMLRVQAHEYSNKLHTLAGMLQMANYQEALELVTLESSGLQSLIQFLNRAVPHSGLAAIIMGKYNRSLEMKVNFQFNTDSTMEKIPADYNKEKLVTILGNLLDNALEAAINYQQKRLPRIQLFMTDIGYDLIFEIEDSGPGVSIALQKKIFTKGYSSKKNNGPQGDFHGIGLYLVNRYVADLNGHLAISTGDLGGALFTLSLPKHPFKKG
ncbi:MAG: sensor histidine kinase [Desulfobacteraceae bacterium]|nr:sensor histidine kinase [Desulfobacteraceae bacterium]